VSKPRAEEPEITFPNLVEELALSGPLVIGMDDLRSLLACVNDYRRLPRF
jgi:hypothetical protein